MKQTLTLFLLLLLIYEIIDVKILSAAAIIFKNFKEETGLAVGIWICTWSKKLTNKRMFFFWKILQDHIGITEIQATIVQESQMHKEWYLYY